MTRFHPQIFPFTVPAMLKERERFCLNVKILFNKASAFLLPPSEPIAAAKVPLLSSSAPLRSPKGSFLLAKVPFLPPKAGMAAPWAPLVAPKAPLVAPLALKTSKFFIFKPSPRRICPVFLGCEAIQKYPTG